MTEVLFSAAGLIFLGYIIGKLFKRFNPFLMLFGALLIAMFYPVFLQMEYRDAATICFVCGIIINFERPVTKFKYWVNDLFGTLSFRRARAGYSADIEKQKEQIEAELNRQKWEMEEEIRRQKREMEEDIRRQKRQAEEDIARQRREEENLKREQERARSNSDNSQSEQSRYRQGNSQDRHANTCQSSNRDSSHLDPKSFSNACEIMGKGQGCSLAEYRAAYKKLVNQNHPDKVFARTGSKVEKEKAEQKTKQLNVAWETIKKKLS